MAIIVGDYTILEQFYLNESFKKALAMDTIEEGAKTSSLVDDAFYIIKKSVRYRPFLCGCGYMGGFIHT